MRAESRSRGLTLVETLVAMALLGMVLSATYATLVLAMRYQQKHDDANTVYQEALRSMNRMEQELGLGSPDSMVVEPEGFVFISAGNPDGPFELDSTSVQVMWQKAVCFYVDNDGVLLMKQQSFPATTTLPPTPSLQSMIDNTSLPATRLADDVTELTVVADASAELTLRVEGKAEDTNAMTLRNRLNFRL